MALPGVVRDRAQGGGLRDPLEGIAAGQGRKGQRDCIDDIVALFRNVLPLVKGDGKIFVVANDRFHLYPEIARRSGLMIVDEFQRAVTKRAQPGGEPYQESVFFMVKSST